MGEMASEETMIDLDQLDYDYIGTGGFVIECGEEREVVGVTKEQTDVVIQNCPFFEKCLQRISEESDGEDKAYDGTHRSIGMREATTRIVRKPDWSVAIVRHFIEIMTKGKTTLPDLELVEGVLAAGDQSLADLRLRIW